MELMKYGNGLGHLRHETVSVLRSQKRLIHRRQLERHDDPIYFASAIIETRPSSSHLAIQTDFV